MGRARSRADLGRSLRKAASRGALEMVERLAGQLGKEGLADRASAGSLGETAGHAAAEAGSAKCLRALVAAGWDPNVADDVGESAGHAAVFFGQEAALEALLEAGWLFLAKNKEGKTAEDMAREEGEEGCETLLRRNRIAMEEAAALGGEGMVSAPEGKSRAGL